MEGTKMQNPTPAPELPELPFADVLEAVKSAANALAAVQGDTPEAIGRLAGQILLTRAQLGVMVELRTNLEHESIHRAEADRG